MTGAQHAEPRGVRAKERILEEEVVREGVDRAAGAEAIVDGERREEAVGRHEAAVVIADEEHRARRRNVLDALDAQPEVVLAREPIEIEQERDELGIARMDVVGAHAAGAAFVASQREAREASDEARGRQQDLSILARDDAARAPHPVDHVPDRPHDQSVALARYAGTALGSASIAPVKRVRR